MSGGKNSPRRIGFTFTAAQARRLLVDTLTDQELTTFYRWMRCKWNTLLPNVADIGCGVRQYFNNNASVLGLYRCAWYIAFGHFPPFSTQDTETQEMYQRVLDSIPSLKEKLNEESHADLSGLEQLGRVTAQNQHVGEVIITKHALERFCERHFTKYESRGTEEVFEKFQKLFEDATPCDISPEHRVKRILNNNFEIAEYLLHTGANLRFVVVGKKDEKGKKIKIISTVERPV